MPIGIISDDENKNLNTLDELESLLFRYHCSKKNSWNIYYNILVVVLMLANKCSYSLFSFICNQQ